jgi:hypothetical protein
MRGVLLSLFAILAGLSSLSMSYDYSAGILVETDYERQRLDASRGAALSAPLDGQTPYWESFNRWQCFPTQGAEISCAEADYGAYLQNYNGDLSGTGLKSGSVWILNRIKSVAGTWSFEADGNWLREEEIPPVDDEEPTSEDSSDGR